MCLIIELLKKHVLEEGRKMARTVVINTIIHSASLAAAGAGAGMAQIPGSDSLAIVPIQIAMITAIALEHGHSISKASAISLISTQAATMAGRKLSQFLVGWIPITGNIINASTAAAITEAMGWLASSYYCEATA